MFVIVHSFSVNFADCFMTYAVTLKGVSVYMHWYHQRAKIASTAVCISPLCVASEAIPTVVFLQVHSYTAQQRESLARKKGSIGIRRWEFPPPTHFWI